MGRYLVSSERYEPATSDEVAKAIDAGSFNEGDQDTRRGILQLLIAKESLAINVLSVEELGTYIAGLAATGRYQLIIDNKSHFTAVDINIAADGTKSCVLLDAVNDPRMIESKKLLDERGYKTNMPLARSKALQSDGFSCPYFAFEHARECALMPDLHQDMERIVETDGTVYLDRLPPAFIKHAQSLRFVDGYCREPKNIADYGATALDALRDHVAAHSKIVFSHKGNYDPLVRAVHNSSINFATQQLLDALYFSRHEAVITAHLAPYTAAEQSHLKGVICNNLFKNISSEKLGDAVAYYMHRYRESRAKISETVGIDALNPQQWRALDEQIMLIYTESNPDIKALREQTLQSYLEHYPLLLKIKNNLRDTYDDEATIFLEVIDFNCIEMQNFLSEKNKRYKNFMKPKFILEDIENYELFLAERRKLFSMEIPDKARDYWSRLTSGQVAVSWDCSKDYVADITQYNGDVIKFNEMLITAGYEPGNDELDAFVKDSKIKLFEHYNMPKLKDKTLAPRPTELFFSDFEKELFEKVETIRSVATTQAYRAMVHDSPAAGAGEAKDESDGLSAGT